MAIDDNATYGLKGSQVKDLAAKLMTSEDVSDQFALNTSIFDNTVESPAMRKIGNQVQLSFPYLRIKVNTLANTWFNVGTIPQSFAPVAGDIQFPASEARVSDGAPLGTFRVELVGTTFRAKAQTAVNTSGGFSSAMSFNTSWLIN